MTLVLNNILELINGELFLSLQLNGVTYKVRTLRVV